MEIDLGGIKATIDLNTGSLDQNLANVKAGMELVKQRTEQLQAGFQAGTVAADKLAEHLATLHAAQERLANIQRAAQATAASNAQAVVNSGNAAGNSAYKWLLLGRAVEDAQFGLSAIVNNIPQIVQSFGGSAGLAGGINIALVVLNQLVNNWSRLMALFGETSGTERAAGSLAALSKRLDEIRARLESGKALDIGEAIDLATGGARERAAGRAEAVVKAGEGPSEEQKRRQDQLEKALREAGGPEALAREAAGKAAPGELLNLLSTDRGGSLFTAPKLRSDRQQAEYLQGRLQQGGIPAETRGRMEQELAALLDTARERLVGQLQKEIGEAGGDAARLNAIRDRFPALAKQLDKQLNKMLNEAGEEGEKLGRQQLEGLAREQEQEAKRQGDEANAEIHARQQRAREIAARMAQGGAGAQELMGAGSLSEEDVRARMRAAGRSESEIDELAGDVWEAITEAIDKQVRERAESRGETEGQARAGLLRDRQDKAADQAQRDIREQAQRVREASPGVEARARRGLLEAQNAGLSREDAAAAVTSALRDSLADSGIDPADLMNGLAEVVRKASAELERDVTGVELNPPPDRRSEVFGGADLASKIQSSIGGPEDTAKEMVRHLAEMRRQLAQLVQDTEQAARQPVVAGLN